MHTLDVWHLNNAKWICIHKFKYNQFTTCMKKKKCLLTTNICTNVFDTEAVQASVTSDMSPFFTNYWITLEFWYSVKAWLYTSNILMNMSQLIEKTWHDISGQLCRLTRAYTEVIWRAYIVDTIKILNKRSMVQKVFPRQIIKKYFSI